MLNSLMFDLELDRTVEKDKHYISPGSYELKCKNKSIRFDFYCSMWNIVEKNIIHIETSDLDTDAFPEAKKLTPEDILEGKFEEIFIFTGDDDVPEIIPTKIKAATFEFINENGSINYLFMNNKKLAEMTKALAS